MPAEPALIHCRAVTHSRASQLINKPTVSSDLRILAGYLSPSRRVTRRRAYWAGRRRMAQPRLTLGRARKFPTTRHTRASHQRFVKIAWQDPGGRQESCYARIPVVGLRAPSKNWESRNIAGRKCRISGIPAAIWIILLSRRAAEEGLKPMKGPLFGLVAAPLSA